MTFLDITLFQIFYKSVEQYFFSASFCSFHLAVLSFCPESLLSHILLFYFTFGKECIYLFIFPGSNGTHDEEKLNNFLEEVLGSGIVADGTVASEPSRMLHIWELRERIAEALIREGYTFKSVTEMIVVNKLR